MTAREIRNYRTELGWKSEDPRIAIRMQIEIAAQLADLNEWLRRPSDGGLSNIAAEREPK